MYLYRHPWMSYVMMTVGAFLLALSVTMFFGPSGMVVGGVTGLAIIIETVSAKLGFAIPIWLTNVLANIPLFGIGFKVFGFKELKKTVFATVALTLLLYVTALLPPFETTDLVLVSVFGGVVGGVGLAMIFLCMATTGGTDTAASLIHVLMLPHFTISKIMFVLDAVIITLGFFVFGPVSGMYALIAVFVTVKVIDAIQEGMSFAKAAFIISEQADTIADAIMKEIERGVTGLKAQGMFSRKDKNVLFCVVSTKEIVKIKALVREKDPNAFVIVADVREVLGEGFNSIA